jgi:hypothetical protein
MKERSSLAAVYETGREAEAAVTRLQEVGLALNGLSIAGSDYQTEEQVVGYYNTGAGMKYWGELRAFWDQVFKSLSGWAFFWIPEIGPILVGGPLVARIVEALAGDAPEDSLSVLGAGLHRVGIPRESILRYQTAIKAGNILVLFDGLAEEVAKAGEALKTTRPLELGRHRNKSDAAAT